MSASQPQSPSRIRLEGDLGIAEARQIYTTATEALRSQQPVLLDWSGAESVGSAVLQVLLALEAELSAAGRPMETTAVPDAIRKTLERCGLERLAGARQGAESALAGGR